MYSVVLDIVPHQFGKIYMELNGEMIPCHLPRHSEFALKIFSVNNADTN